jgi:hypothetical protein
LEEKSETMDLETKNLNAIDLRACQLYDNANSEWIKSLDV